MTNEVLTGSAKMQVKVVNIVEFLILLIRDMVVKRSYRRFGCETIHPIQKCILMNLLQMSCVITWAWSFLTSKVVEAVRGQKHLGTLTQCLVHSSAPVLLTKDSPRNLISDDSHCLSLHSASISQILEPSPQAQGLISSSEYFYPCFFATWNLCLGWKRQPEIAFVMVLPLVTVSRQLIWYIGYKKKLLFDSLTKPFC